MQLIRNFATLKKDMHVIQMNKANTPISNIKRKTTKERVRIHHKWNKRIGLYSFLGKNFLKLILLLAGIVFAILILDWVFDLKHQQEVIKSFVNSLKPVYVFLFFYATESFMGMIPPDIFIVWSKARFSEHPYLLVTILGTISYLGGITAYYLGKLIRRSKRVESYIKRKYEKNFDMIEKWGGMVIIMAALFPLPFAMISTIAGMVKYPVKTFLLFGLTRYIRFYLYAVVIFGVLKDFF